MNIIGIGIDILDTRRILKLISKSSCPTSKSSCSLKNLKKFKSKILSTNELNQFNELIDFPLLNNDDVDDHHLNKIIRFLSNRWVVKEAAYKALYPIYKPTWKQFTLLKHSSSLNSNKPLLTYNPNLTPSEQKQKEEEENEEETPDDQKIKKNHLLIPSFHLSISHDSHLVLATVLAFYPPKLS